MVRIAKRVGWLVAGIVIAPRLIHLPGYVNERRHRAAQVARIVVQRRDGHEDSAASAIRSLNQCLSSLVR